MTAAALALAVVLAALSDNAFARLAPLSRGLIRVTISGARAPALPPTDTAPPTGRALWELRAL